MAKYAGFCGTCGTRFEPLGRFCGTCGSPRPVLSNPPAPRTQPPAAEPPTVHHSALLPAPTSGEQEPGQAHHSPAARISLAVGDGQVIPDAGRVLIGRNPVSDMPGDLTMVMAEDLALSRTHVAIERDSADRVWLVDLYATNGVTLTRAGSVARVLDPGERIKIMPGDLIQFGDQRITVTPSNAEPFEDRQTSTLTDWGGPNESLPSAAAFPARHRSTETSAKSHISVTHSPTRTAVTTTGTSGETEVSENLAGPSNPVTEPKKLPSRGERTVEGLSIAAFGVGAWLLFFLIRAVIHVRFMILPVAGLLMIGAGLYYAFSRDESPTRVEGE